MTGNQRHGLLSMSYDTVWGHGMMCDDGIDSDTMGQSKAVKNTVATNMMMVGRCGHEHLQFQLSFHEPTPSIFNEPQL